MNDDAFQEVNKSLREEQLAKAWKRWSIFVYLGVAAIVIGVLLFTNLEPFNASAVALALVAFIFIYLIRLIGVANTPFRAEGATQDDVSLFLVEEALAHLRGDGPERMGQADAIPHAAR